MIEGKEHMKIEKKILGRLERVYAVSHMEVLKEPHYLVATEGEGECRMIHAETLEERIVWKEPGGTMNIVPLPGVENEFYATQKFLPTFNAAECLVVHAKCGPGYSWTVTPVMSVPYLHRFDVFPTRGGRGFIGCTLCGSKKSKEDWADPGTIVVGLLKDDVSQPFSLKELPIRITKNHGFCATTIAGRRAFLVTGVEGVFTVFPPVGANDEWRIEKIFDHEVSDCAVWDIDGDGQLEIATIEPFHGNLRRVYKKFGDDWVVVHEHPCEFGHVVWGGLIAGRPSFLLGSRKGRRELVRITCTKGVFVEETIDDTGGPSNIAVRALGDRDIVLAANREIGEYCIYELKA